MPPNARGNWDNLIAFRQKQAEDVELLVKSQGPEFAIAGDLKPGQYVANIEDEIQRGTSWGMVNGKFVSINL
ncbi:hypothetical protein [Pelagicoccus sp. SDUM812005]|uniref:hypothetical protein n=1 Tax=Pelagicoccus sp. SDUM812005 TaxID=3041257 RepID=UPI00281003D2|nr:hypothetical protein [Pelagicoccus sp. SDUM812005]MDQ8183750.1 hypothetical protein [Pelagicoccus sp. SDUM812005]